MVGRYHHHCRQNCVIIIIMALTGRNSLKKRKAGAENFVSFFFSLLLLLLIRFEILLFLAAVCVSNRQQGLFDRDLLDGTVTNQPEELQSHQQTESHFTTLKTICQKKNKVEAVRRALHLGPTIAEVSRKRSSFENTQ